MAWVRGSRILGGATALLIVSPAFADDGPAVKRVTLSSSGMLQIERAAHVSGKAQIVLPVPAAQVDDVLKSLSVFDGAGSVESVRLPGQDSLAQVFRTLPFGQQSLASPEALLGALKGANVTIGGPRTIHGRIVSVEAVTTRDGQATMVTGHRLTVLTQNGLESVDLDAAQSVSLDDPALRADLDKALAATLASHAQDQRPVTIDLSGQGARDVTLSYVVPAPIWKTTYRLLLGKDGKGSVLQGWAIMENMTGSDWNGVDLTIVSGNPVTLHQALYQSYYVRRPEVPVQVFGQLNPRMDNEVSYGSASVIGGFAPPPPPMAAPAPAPPPMMLRKAEPSLAPGATAVASSDAGAQVYFHFPHPVSVAAGQSLMVPFIDRNLPVEKLWLYQPDTDATHPLAAFRLKNDGASSLPAGIVTVYDGDGHQFTGDAQLANLARGDSRLVSYALDQKTTISKDEKSDDTLVSITADRGVLHVKRLVTAETDYMAQASADEARTLIIEQPKRDGFTLQDAEGVEETPSLYRFRLTLKPAEKRSLKVRLIQPVQDETQISDMADDVLDGTIASAREIGNPQAVASLSKIAEQIRQLADIKTSISKLDAENARISKDQERLRANLGSVPKEGDLARRYITALQAQENRLDEIAKQRDGQAKAQADAEASLNATIAGASF